MQSRTGPNEAGGVADLGWRARLAAQSAAVSAAIPRWVKVAFAVSLIGGGLYGAGAWTFSFGRSAIEKAARDRGLCEASDCTGGIERVENVLAKHYAISPTTLEWCLGVDEWRHTRVHRGGLFKMILVDVMDTPCGALHPQERAGP